MRPFEIQPGGGVPEIYGNVSYDSSEIAINTQVNSHKNTFPTREGEIRVLSIGML